MTLPLFCCIEKVLQSRSIYRKKYLKKKDANAHEWILKIGTKGQKHMLDIAKCEFPAED